MGKSIYLVQRITWETGWDKSFNSGEWRVSKPVRAFALRKEAEEWKAEAEARVRKELSPFQFANDLQYEDTEVTSLTQTEILNAIRELGLKAPKKRKRYGEKIY